METQLVRDFSSVHSVGKILLVGEDEEEGWGGGVAREAPPAVGAVIGPPGNGIGPRPHAHAVAHPLRLLEAADLSP